MNRVYEAEGPDAIVDAAKALLESDRYDMAAVRSVIDKDDDLLEELDDGSQAKDRQNRERLNALLPQLRVVENLIKQSWVKTGYSGMDVADGFMLDQWRKPGILPHVDGLAYRDRRIEAGIQLSLCVKGLRNFMAERLPNQFRNQDGSFDAGAYSTFYQFDGMLQAQLDAGRVPRSSTTVGPGDIAMFPHHPVVTLHGVSLLEPSIARLITFNAEKVTTRV